MALHDNDDIFPPFVPTIDRPGARKCQNTIDIATVDVQNVASSGNKTSSVRVRLYCLSGYVYAHEYWFLFTADRRVGSRGEETFAAENVSRAMVLFFVFSQGMRKEKKITDI